jgi:hypothetical protein
MAADNTVAVVGIVATLLSSLSTLAIKGWVDSRLEGKKAKLNRASRVFERRLDAILSLNSLLHDATALYREFVAPFGLVGRPSKDVLGAKAWDAYQAFVEEYFRLKVLLPLPLATQAESLIQAFWNIGIRVSTASELARQDGEARAKEWAEIHELMATQIPELQAGFELECRSILDDRSA